MISVTRAGVGTSVSSAEIANDSIVNADVNTAAAIAYSKLNLATSLVNADVSAAGFTRYDRTQGQVGVIAPSCLGWAYGGLSPAASRAYLMRFVPSRNMAVTKIGFVVQTAGADVGADVGLYSAAGALLVSSGSTTGKLNAAGNQTITVTSTPLTAGTAYYAAFCATAGTTAVLTSCAFSSFRVPTQWGTAVGAFDGDFKDTAFPLPDPIGATGGGSANGLALQVRES